jgi:hypothetical protein
MYLKNLESNIKYLFKAIFNMDLNEIGKLVDEKLAKQPKNIIHQWLNERRRNYRYASFGSCECGEPATEDYQPCCSYNCWSKKFDK